MLEQELKVQLEAEEAHSLATALKPPIAAWLQENIYLDTLEGALRKQRVGLRLRAEWIITPPDAREELLNAIGLEGEPSGLGEPGWMLTLKGPTTRRGALHVRSEHELSIGPEVAGRIRAEGLDPEQLPWPPLSQQLDGLRRDPQVVLPGAIFYRPLGAIRTLRRRFPGPVPDGSASGWMDLDVTLYPDGSRGYELEFEFEPGSITQATRSALSSAQTGLVTRAAEALLRARLSGLNIPWRPSPEGKFSRFLKRQRT